MNARQLHALRLRETDVASALQRLGGNETLYDACLRAFLDDQTVAQLNATIRSGSWDEAFTAAHALKGVAGNMGLVPLMHNTGQLIVQIRGGRIHEIPQAMEQVNSSYRDITDGIHQYFAFAAKNDEEKKYESEQE